MARTDATPPRTDGSVAAATGCFLSWWWFLAALLVLVLIGWAIVPWWRARYVPAEPAPAPVERSP